MTTFRRAAPVLAVLPLLLTACGGAEAPPEESVSASASSTSAASPSSSPSSSTASTTDPSGTTAPTEEEPAGGLPPFVADGEPAQADAGSAELEVTDLRTARQDGFDRVVVELAGEGSPGYFVQYVDAPTRQGSGDPVEMAGEAFLVLLARGVVTPGGSGAPTYAGPDRLIPDDTTVVREVVAGTSYEGGWDASVGLSERRPYRVFALADPPRVVLDVAHDG